MPATALLFLCLVLLRRPRFRGFIVGLAGRLWNPWPARLDAALAQLGGATALNGLAWVMTVAIWALAAGTNQLIFLALDLRLPWTAAPFLLGVLHLGGLIRLAPGQIGVFHYLTILALGAFGADRAAGFACGLVLHLVVVGPPMALGAWTLRREGIYWSQLIAAAVRLARGGRPAESVAAKETQQ